MVPKTEMNKRHCSNFKQSGAKVKPARGKAVPTEKTRWAYWMQAIAPDSAEINAAFPGYHPLWVQQSQRLTVGPENFAHIRQHCLQISIDQAAAYLRVERAEVEAWEQGARPVPFMAFELLRLVYESVAYRLSHAKWDGWFLNRSGEFVSPDAGKMAVTPAEVANIPSLQDQIATLKAEAKRLRDELDAQEAENARLRALFSNQGITSELEAMQARIGDLMASIQTAQVIPMPNRKAQKKAAA